MIWIVSKKVVDSKEKLEKRRCYIQKITQTKVSPWNEQQCLIHKLFNSKIGFYQCISKKGEYGIIVTAHSQEILPILEHVLNNKKALVIVNSCTLNQKNKDKIITLVKKKNKESEIFFAKQENIGGQELNFIENVGNFGFETTQSERELLQNKQDGLNAAIRKAYVKEQ